MNLKEKQIYERSLKPTTNNLKLFHSVCLLSKNWQQEYFNYLDSVTGTRKINPVNSDLITNPTSEDNSRLLKRKEDIFGLNEVLKSDLKISDFYLVDEELMDFLISKYRGFKLKRPVRTLETYSLTLDYFPLKLKVVFLSIKEFLIPNSLEKSFDCRYIQVFPFTKFMDFKQEILDIMKIYLQNSQIGLGLFRIWASSIGLNDLFEDLKIQIHEKSPLIKENSVSFNIEAENLEFHGQKTLKQLNLTEETVLLVEIKLNKENPWFFTLRNRKSSLKRNYATFAPLLEIQENYDYSNVFHFNFYSIIFLLILFK